MVIQSNNLEFESTKSVEDYDNAHLMFVSKTGNHPPDIKRIHINRINKLVELLRLTKDGLQARKNNFL